MSPDFPTIPSLIFAGLWVLFLLAVYAVLFHIGPRVAAALKIMRQSTAEVMEDVEAPTGDRDEWDTLGEDAVLLTCEKCDDDEDNQTAADFLLWDAEVAERSGVHKYMRRMDRWSR